MSADEVETKARTMGWLPKEKFKGPESSWVDAEQYVKRGEEILPILKANNDKLVQRVTQTETANNELREQLQAATEAIEELKSFNSTLNKEKVKDQKTEILAAIAAAKREGDVDTEVRLTDQLTEINLALKAPAPEPKKVAQPAAPILNPTAQAWMAENPWFGTDKKKTAIAMAVSDEFKAEGGVLGTKAHFDKVDQEIRQMFDSNLSRREGPSKVEGTAPSESSGRGNSRTFADLPPDAQVACKEAAKRLVGPNRAYKTLADWQKRYVEVYDWS